MIHKADRDFYVVVDIETAGVSPGFASMLSIGAVAISHDRQVLGEFEVNLEELPEFARDVDTMKFWADFPAAWAAHRVNPQKPDEAICAFARWVRAMQGAVNAPVLVAAPALFDGAFLHWYFHRYGLQAPFCSGAIDMRTVAMMLNGSAYRYSNKRDWPAIWKSKLPHTHVAIEDAREQADSFVRMLETWHQHHGEPLSITVDRALPE